MALIIMNLLTYSVNCYDRCENVECPKLKCGNNEIVEVLKGDCCGKCKSVCVEMCKDTKCPHGFTKAKVLGSCCEICIENRQVNYDNIKNYNTNNTKNNTNTNTNNKNKENNDDRKKDDDYTTNKKQ